MGSSDLYEHTGRKPWASINFVTCHDGFTLADLVSYDRKHNEENGEDNRDGTDTNLSWNCGVEGPTDDPAVKDLRALQARNLLATLYLSQGVPMLLAGDELGRTQRGNNNAYCQDNETSWLDWDGKDTSLLEFTRRLAALRRSHAVFRRSAWFPRRQLRHDDANEIAWFLPDGTQMRDEDWDAGFARSIAVMLAAEGSGDSVRELFYLIFNAYWEPIGFALPGDLVGNVGDDATPEKEVAGGAGVSRSRSWAPLMDTSRVSDPFFTTGEQSLWTGEAVTVSGRSVLVLRSAGN
jgi:glycogen operon protein